MSAFEGAEAVPRSQAPGSCSFEPVTNAVAGPPSLSVTCERFGAGVAQSVLPPVLTSVLPSPPSKLLGLTVAAAKATVAEIARSAHAATRAAGSARAIEMWEVMTVLAGR